MKKKMERIHVQMDKELVERIAEKQAEIKEKTGLRCSRSFIVRELVNKNIENFMNEPENGTRMTHDSTTFQDATAQEWHTDDTTFVQNTPTNITWEHDIEKDLLQGKLQKNQYDEIKEHREEVEKTEPGTPERDFAISLLGELSKIYCWDEFTKFKE